MPRLDLTLVLTDRPEAIHQRKAERSVPQIRCRLVAYQRVARDMGRFHVVNTSGGVEVARRRVLAAILDEVDRAVRIE
jgi:hypothetical protein